MSIGFMNSEPDGQFGPDTRTAIRNFQQANGFQEGLYLTAQQRQLLLASPASQVGEALEFNTGQSGQSGAPQRFPETQPDQSQAQRSPDAPQPGQQAQAFPTAPTGQAGASFARPRATETARTGTVEVTASGDTPDAARKEAARMAVQQVAGVFIDDRRRSDINMSDNVVHEVIEEKLLSYTNAYVSSFEVLSTEYRSGVHKITAKVTVAVAPLLKTLQANNVPTVKFDSDFGGRYRRNFG